LRWLVEKDKIIGLKLQNVQEKNFVGHFIVSLVALSIFFANIWHSGLWYPDAPSHALNGVFYKDMIEQGGVLHPTSYAERYYVQYPSLTIGVHPPVFYTIEALFFKIFGVSPLVAKLTVLLFTILGVNIFFLLSRVWLPLGLSVVGSILYLLQPATLFVQNNVMLEMPALAMSIMAVYCLYIGTERGKPWALFLAPLCAAVAFLTKQNTIFLLPIWFVWITLGRKWNLIKSGYFILGVLIGTIILIPWVIVNLSIGKSYMVNAAFDKYHIWSNCLYYLRHFSDIVSYPVILMSILSVILFVKLKEHNGYKFVLLWGCSVLLFLLLIKLREPRFATFLVPTLILLSMQVIWFFRAKVTSFVQHRSLCPVLMIALICLHLNPQRVMGGRDIQGFHQAADFVTRDLDCVSVLYDGYFNSNFIFHMRARDKDRRIFVFRASKVIYSTMLNAELGYNELIHEISDFYDILNGYSIKYVIQEQKNLLNTQANKRLRQWIQGPEFKLVGRYPTTTRGSGGPGNLLIYEYLNYEAKGISQIDLDMPVLGRKISVKLK
jgi:hypothetical protein